MSQTHARPDEAEVFERIRALDDDDVTLHGAFYVYDTQYAWVYLVAKTQVYQNNEQLHLRYAALSKPDAYPMDQWKSGGMSIRMIDGMSEALPALVARACNEGFDGTDSTQSPLYEVITNDEA